MLLLIQGRAKDLCEFQYAPNTEGRRHLGLVFPIVGELDPSCSRILSLSLARTLHRMLIVR